MRFRDSRAADRVLRCGLVHIDGQPLGREATSSRMTSGSTFVKCSSSIRSAHLLHARAWYQP
jgi:hypothetical protein